MKLLFLIFTVAATLCAERPPNVVLIYADDLGYADLSSFGNKKVQTPNIDRLGKQGQRYRNFHVAQAVCSASRAALLTGCYPNRIGIHGALGPNATHGLHSNEVTIAGMLKQRGYATGMAGKWHLGHHTKFLPIHHGFDEYLGLPYSNDMWPHHPEAKKGTYPPLPLIEGDQIIDAEVTPEEQTQLTARYTGRAVDFIARNKSRPFFFYLAYAMPHVPLFVSEKFKGKSGAGLYGDVLMEIDWSVGEVMRALKENGLEKNTLVIFTSDNGPWLSYGEHAGSSGSFREGKGTSWEGGVRVPCVIRWPGGIQGPGPGHYFMNIDLLPTIAAITGARLPTNAIDGRSVITERNRREPYAIYFADNELQAVNSADGRWKLILPHQYRTLQGPGGTNGIPSKYTQVKLEKPELYDLKNDPSEKIDVAKSNPKTVARLLLFAEKMRADLGDSLTKRTGSGIREPGRL